MVRSADESGKKLVILLYFYFRQLTVSHSEKKQDKNKAFSISHNTTRTLFKHYLSFKQPMSFNWCNLGLRYMNWFYWGIRADYALALIKTHSTDNKVIRKRTVNILTMKTELFCETPWCLASKFQMSHFQEVLKQLLFYTTDMFWSKHKLCLDIKQHFYNSYSSMWVLHKKGLKIIQQHSCFNFRRLRRSSNLKKNKNYNTNILTTRTHSPNTFL